MKPPIMLPNTHPSGPRKTFLLTPGPRPQRSDMFVSAPKGRVASDIAGLHSHAETCHALLPGKMGFA
jgi:hypothetical protein